MFRWNKDMIRFLQDASEFCDYYGNLAVRIMQELPNGDICDAGCGLGYLSLALSPYCRSLTAVDICPEVLTVLKQNCLTHSLGNITIRCGEIEKIPPETPYDGMVFCFFGRMEEILRIAKAQCRGRIVVIKKGWERHRFSLHHEQMHHETFADAEGLLQSLGVPFHSEIITMEMGQPLRSLDDAVRFFEIYHHGETGVTLDEVKRSLIRMNSEEFPYYLPSQKRMGFLSLDTGDLPDSI